MTSTSSVPPSAVALAAVHDRSAAEVLARALLARAILPPGATAVTKTPPAALAQPFDRPGTPNLADVSRFAAAPESAAQAIRFLTSHHPRGYTVDGGGTGKTSGGGAPTVSSVTDPLTGMPTGVDAAQLLIDVVPIAAGHVGIRVDAQVTWLPAKPHGLAVPTADVVAIVSVTESNPGYRKQVGSHLPTPRRVVVTRPGLVARLGFAAYGLRPRCPVRSAAHPTSAPATSSPSRSRPLLRRTSFTVGSCGGVEVSRRSYRLAALADDSAFTRLYRQILGLRG